jgi:TetR/AcrR family transcriptional regulator, transcriptional repressor for nem operon
MARGAHKRGRTNDPQGLRARILDAAAACFQREGYGGANIREIARIAGVTSGAFHHHFPTKKALGLAVLEERVAVEVQVTWIGEVQSARSAIEGVLTVFEKIIGDLDRRRRVEGCPVNNVAMELALLDEDFRLGAQRIFERWRHAIEVKAEEDLAAGERSVLPAAVFGHLAVAQFSGAMAMAKAAQNTAPLRESARLLERLCRLESASASKR